VDPVSRSVELAAPPAAVWAALTRPELFSQWFGANGELEQRAGGRAVFRWPDGSEKTAVVEAVEVPHLLLLRFHPFERDPAGVVRQGTGGHIRFLLRETESGGTRFEIEDSTSSSLPLAGLPR
jgi:uncharacterized protein YndB with AHSA1/START domain